MSTKKTISDLPSWGGDPSMRMHVHKPGSSQALTLSEFAGLITTGEGLQVGDVVLRPNGVYADALECDGKLRPTADFPVLAGKLNIGAFGTTPISVNANSGTRFGTANVYGIAQLGKVKVAGEAGQNRIYVDNILSSSIAQSGQANAVFLKSEKALYFKERKASGAESVYGVSKEGLVSIVWTATGLTDVVGVVSLNATVDVVFIKTSAAVIAVRYDTTSVSLGVQIGALDAQGSLTPIACQAENGNVYFAGVAGGVQGLHKLTVTSNAVSSDLIVSGAQVRLVGGKSNYLLYGTGNLEFRLNAEDDTSVKVVMPASYYSGLTYGASFVVLNGLNGARPVMSFDGGSSWENVPEMTGYRAVDYDHTAGEVIVAGNVGTAGSVNGQSGSMQNNAMNFPSNVVFRTPKISSGVAGLKAFIKT